MMCKGCHEPSHQTPELTKTYPIALKREASIIKPEAEGSNPFNYVKLVQPVLDRNCVECHDRKKAVNLSGKLTYVRDRDGRNWPYTQSYISLAEEYGFWFQTLINSLNATG